MITEDYVGFKTAKLLKEKGFDGDTDLWYNENGARACLAPTLQMTMKWLMEVHNIHINLDIHWFYFANALGWMYIITKILENGVDYVEAKGDEDDKTFYSTYEDACEAAIRYCLENLI